MIKNSGIVTIFNEEENCLSWLESYYNQTILCDELIIVDGLSTDNSLEIIQKISKKYPSLKIKLFKEKLANRKFSCSPIAEGRNIAIKKSSGKNIICFDFGCTYPKNYVENITRLLESYPIVGGLFSLKNKTSYIQKSYSKFFMPTITDLEEGFIPSSRSLGFKKKLWEKVGGYSSKYITGEDTHFITKITNKGVVIGYCQNTDVTWEGPTTLSEVYSKHKSYAKGKAAYNLEINIIYRLICMFFPIYFLSGGFIVKYAVNMANIHGYLYYKLNNLFKTK
ncbi:MAG: glycosyltransferase [Flavobacteriaceae bacterium]|nr:glycosyltransferase [Flavobacteriaceae bacterium]